MRSGSRLTSVRVGVDGEHEDNPLKPVQPRRVNRISPLSPVVPPAVPLGRGLVLIAIGVLILDQLAIQGLVTPVVVTSGSMFPTLRGPHWKSRCPRCGREVLWDSTLGERRTTLLRAVCPACGKRWAEVEPGESVAAPPVDQDSGDRILVFRGLVRPMRRWDLVAIRQRNIPGLVVKRVVGLPGERLSGRNGVLYRDGVPLRRPVEVQWEMARVLERCNSDDGQGLVLSAQGIDKDSAEWLFSRRLTTFCPYHPAVDQEERPCTNVLWSISLARIDPGAVFSICAGFGDHRIEVTCSVGDDPSVDWQVFAGEKGLVTQGKRMFRRAFPQQIVISSVDRRWLLLMDGTCLLADDWDDGVLPGAVPVALRLHVNQGKIRLRDMSVCWVMPYPDGVVAPAGDGFVLLGDDPHISLDSRQGGRRWRREDVVGVVRPLRLARGGLPP